MAPIPEVPSPPVLAPELGFSILHQKVELDIDLATRSLRGRTEITLSPHRKDLKSVRLNCRQCALIRLTANGKACSGITYTNPYNGARLPWRAGVHQHHMLYQKLEGQLKNPPEEELVVNLPRNFKIDELDPFSEEAQSMVLSKTAGSSKGDGSSNALDVVNINRASLDQSARFSPIQLNIEYVITYIRDGLQFVGWEEGDFRYPHAYTKKSLSPGAACCLFPCTDSLSSRCTWEISIKCQKTIGDVFGNIKSPLQVNGGDRSSAIADRDTSFQGSNHKHTEFSDEDKALDLAVICTGNITDEVSSHGCLADVC